ncbi:hypothetical protein LCGC14_3023430 [marine sediment metagenome]|uniref:Uncharacterized protein n=1 Tax=marine sediment metagenome TaxID=412755 RepID=A0A0F8ZKQ4_9ZZZZ
MTEDQVVSESIVQSGQKAHDNLAVQMAVERIAVIFNGAIGDMNLDWRDALSSVLADYETALLTEKERELESMDRGNDRHLVRLRELEDSINTKLKRACARAEQAEALVEELRDEKASALIAVGDLERVAEQAEAAVAQARDGIRFQLGYSTATPFKNVSDTEVEVVVGLGKEVRRALSGSTDETAGVKGRAMPEMTPVDKSSALWQQWIIYRGTAEYAYMREWAGDNQHVKGSLWAAFMAGFKAGEERPDAD